MVMDNIEKNLQTLLTQLNKMQDELSRKEEELALLSKENAKLKNGSPLRSKQVDGIYSIQRKKGITYGFSIRDENGRKIKREGFATKAEALAKKSELILLKDKRKLSEQTKNRKTDFRYFTDEYLKMAEKEFSVNTVEATKGIIKNHLKPLLDIKISDLNKQVARNWANENRNKLGASAYNNTLKKCKAIWNYALKIGLTTLPNPFEHIKPICITKENKIRRDVRISKQQIDLLIKAAQELFDDYTAYIIACAGYGALRRGECLGLKWEDIDFDRQTLYVNTQVQKVTKKHIKSIQLKNPHCKENDIVLTTRLKTKSSKAIIAVPEHLINLLKEYREKLISTDGLNQLCFCSPEGKALVPDDFVRYKFKKVLKAVFGDENYMHFHELRGSCATILHLAGVQSKIIQRLLRHSKQSITEDIYIDIDSTSGIVSNELNRVFT